MQVEAPASQSDTTIRLNNLCDLFFAEVAAACDAARRLGEAARESVFTWPEAGLRRTFRRIASLIDRYTYRMGEVLGISADAIDSHPSHAMAGLLLSWRDQFIAARHPGVRTSSAVNTLRHATRYMESLCHSIAETASLLGFDPCERLFLDWAAEWHDLQPELHRAALRASTSAYMAGVTVSTDAG